MEVVAVMEIAVPGARWSSVKSKSSKLPSFVEEEEEVEQVTAQVLTRKKVYAQQ